MTTDRTFIVTLRHQFPAWDEVTGIDFEVQAASKSEANAEAKRQAERDGFLMTGKGRATFTAVEIDSAPAAPAQPQPVDFTAVLQANPQIGALNSGLFYVYPVGGEYRESRNPLDLI